MKKFKLFPKCFFARKSSDSLLRLKCHYTEASQSYFIPSRLKKGHPLVFRERRTAFESCFEISFVKFFEGVEENMFRQFIHIFRFLFFFKTIQRFVVILKDNVDLLKARYLFACLKINLIKGFFVAISLASSLRQFEIVNAKLITALC